MAVRHAPRNRWNVQATVRQDRWSHKQNSAYGLLGPQKQAAAKQKRFALQQPVNYKSAVVLFTP